MNELTVPLSDDENARLSDLERVIYLTYIDRYVALNAIREGGLYREHGTFWDYIKARFDKSENWYYQLQRSASVAMVALEHDLQFKNRGAVREFRAQFSGWITAGWLDVVIEAFIDIVDGVAGDAPVTASMVRALSDVTADVLNTGGYVYTHETETMTAFAESVEDNLQEARKRRAAKYNKWYNRTAIIGRPLVLEGYIEGDTIEIKVKKERHDE